MEAGLKRGWRTGRGGWYGRSVVVVLVLRRMQILVWVLESREHATFRDKWQSWAR